MQRQILKQQVTEATKRLKGVTTLEVLQERYKVRFRFLDSNTGFHYYEVTNILLNHRYTVKIRFAKSELHRLFAVISGYCQCPKFHREGNCQHLLLAVYDESVKCNLSEYFDFGKFTELNLAKSYFQQIHEKMAEAA